MEELPVNRASRSGLKEASQKPVPLQLRATGAELKVMQELMQHSTIHVTLDTTLKR